MLNPKMSGISSITGRTVYIRHATDWDLFMIGRIWKRLEKKEALFTRDNVVVALEEDRIIGFAILESPAPALGGTMDTGCVTIFEDSRRRGIGAQVVSHLMEYAPVKTVYTATGRPGYFRRAGFTKAGSVPVNSLGNSYCLCRLPRKRGAIAMKYVRATPRSLKAA